MTAENSKFFEFPKTFWIDFFKSVGMSQLPSIRLHISSLDSNFNEEIETFLINNSHFGPEMNTNFTWIYSVDIPEANSLLMLKNVQYVTYGYSKVNNTLLKIPIVILLKL